MSYILTDDSGGRRRTSWLIGVVGAVLVLVVAAVLVLRPHSSTSGPAAAPTADTAPRIAWDVVGDEPVPLSPQHGPAQRSNGLAAGFTHDELGAALAAINIGARLTAEAGPAVYETTARQQCFGDVDTTIRQIRGARSSTPPGSTVPSEFFYKITKGDPSEDLVLVALAVATPQGTANGGFVGVTRTLQWRDGDWRMQVPLAPAQLTSSVASYHSLGSPDV